MFHTEEKGMYNGKKKKKIVECQCYNVVKKRASEWTWMAKAKGRRAPQSRRVFIEQPDHLRKVRVSGEKVDGMGG